MKFNRKTYLIFEQFLSKKKKIDVVNMIIFVLFVILFTFHMLSIYCKLTHCTYSIIMLSILILKYS